jgi:membrane protease YdiL (CAAX protease family)
MQAFTRFIVLLVLALLAGAVLAYPVWLLVELFASEPIHRVMHRAAMLAALVGMIWLTRHMQLANRGALGYGQPRRQFTRQLLLGWLIGAAIMVPLMVMLYQLDIRILKPKFGDISALALTALAGAASGLTVAFIEETFFRGVLYSAVERESGTTAAIVLPSLLYAALHFLNGRLRIPDSEVDWSSGFAVLVKVFERFSEPVAIVDSFLALLGVGVLLAVVRSRTRSVAASMGMHAAWVCIIAFVRKTSRVNPDAHAHWLVGSYDGVIGWGALAWIGVFLLLYIRLGKPHAAPAASA